MSREYEVEIKGITPYLMNRFSEGEIDSTVKKHSGSQHSEDDLKYEAKHYRTPDGKIYVPATQLIGCLINAGKQLKVVGKGKSTYSKLFGANLIVEPEAILMSNQSPVPYRISAVNPNTRGRVMTVRPRFEEWALKFRVVSQDDQIPAEVINSGLAIAGNSVGIGDWRPDKKGRFGKFMVTSFKEVI